METNKPNANSFDEQQSLKVISEMIKVSQKKLKNDGVLFILWGWLMLYNYISSYFLGRIILTHQIKNVINYFGLAIGACAVAYSVYYIIKQHKKVQTYIGISLRYVWFSLLICLSLTNMIIFNVIHHANFELQHPIFMMFIAFATVITGGILRYKLIISGGIIFGILAYICSFFPLQEQLLFEAAAWFIAFIIPGHILYSKRVAKTTCSTT